MEQKTLSSSASLQAMTEMQAAVLLVESYLTENYQFRRNVLSVKTEYRTDGEWCVVTQPAVADTSASPFRKGALIDNLTPIDHAQLYAQVMHEIEVDEIPYWFGNDEVARIQKANLPFFKTDDMEGILRLCYRLPEGEEQGEWLTCKEVCNVLSKQYPSMKVCNQTKIRIGQTLKYLGCTTKHTRYGAVYNLVSLAA